MLTANHSPSLPGGTARHHKASDYFDPHREPYDRHRRGWGAQPLFAILQCEAVHPGQKTRAPSPCWRDSTTKPVKWRKVATDEAAELIRQLEDYERQTRQPGRQDGAIGRNGLAVFRALIFGFLNYATGRLDPGYKAIARMACISVAAPLPICVQKNGICRRRTKSDRAFAKCGRLAAAPSMTRGRSAARINPAA